MNNINLGQWLKIFFWAALCLLSTQAFAAETAPLGENPYVRKPVTTDAAQISETAKAPEMASEITELPEAAEAAESTKAPVIPKVTAAAKVDDKRTLDDRVQSLKKEVKSLNRDLFILEEELLFPSSTQVAIFLSIDIGNFFRLDSVQLKIDDKIVANHLYTKRELGALERGGVQRLYIGNVKSGEHELVASFRGPGPNNREYKRATTIKFKKGSAAKFMELKILDATHKLQPEFVVKEWE